jgi:hypothetical protein
MYQDLENNVLQQMFEFFKKTLHNILVKILCRVTMVAIEFSH